jgi:predicted O-methyltransferase YrrM
VNKGSKATTVSTPLPSARTETPGETNGERSATPQSRASRLKSVVLTGAELLGVGNRRAGLVAFAVLACGGFLLPLFLMIVFADGRSGSAVLGLMLGLIVDLLAVMLLIAVVTYEITSRRQSGLTRSLRTVVTRSSNLERSLAELVTRTSNMERSLGELVTRTSRLETWLGEPSEAGGRQAGARVATRADVGTAVKELGDRFQATQNLFALVRPRGLVPPMVGYVAAPDVLVVLVHKFLSLRPRLAIECGSGTSTLFLALAAQQYGVDCRLVSLEHDLAYAQATRTLVADHGVGHLVDIRHAPLTTTPLTDHSGPWYDPAAFDDLHDIGLAFVDGPPRDVGPQARYPMVPLLADRLGDTCAILLDDVKRPDERAVAERWAAQLADFSYRYLPLIRGVGIFTRGC